MRDINDNKTPCEVLRDFILGLVWRLNWEMTNFPSKTKGEWEKKYMCRREKDNYGFLVLMLKLVLFIRIVILLLYMLDIKLDI